jgi:HK97 family phage prohead protease
MLRTHRTFALDVRSAKPDGSSFEGYCTVFNSIDSYGTIMARGCVDKHLDFFRSNGFLAGLNHDWDNPAGKIDSADVDTKGLKVSASIIDTSRGLDLRKIMASGICKKMSFGFDILSKTYLETSEQVEEYWKSVGYSPTAEDQANAKYGAGVINEVKIFEASPVMVPGNDRADITAVRADVSNGPLESHLSAVRATVEALCDRLEQVASLRAKDGRSLSPDKRALVSVIHARIDKAMAACRPMAKVDEVGKFRAELLQYQSLLT